MGGATDTNSEVAGSIPAPDQFFAIKSVAANTQNDAAHNVQVNTSTSRGASTDKLHKVALR